MFDIGFSEVLLIFVIALVVLGPEKLPRAASQVGRWIGRARAMARQFKDQLEEEVNLENVRKAHKEAAAKEEAAGGGTTGAGLGAAGVATAGAAGQPGAGASPETASSAAGDGMGYTGPDPADFRADTFSHAHATNEFGANPATANGGPPEELTPDTSASQTPASTVESGASSPSAPFTAEVVDPSDNTHRTDSTEAYAPSTTLNPKLPASEPVPATQSDNHGHS
jgi:sec-independent protein translocase protein TatB